MSRPLAHWEHLFHRWYIDLKGESLNDEFCERLKELIKKDKNCVCVKFIEQVVFCGQIGNILSLNVSSEIPQDSVLSFITH